jgi:hypothetical protein
VGAAQAEEEEEASGLADGKSIFADNDRRVAFKEC